MNIEQQYLNTLRDVLHRGVERSDRTGVGTLSLFGLQLRHDLSQGFPLLTTKKTLWKPILGELLWFIEGSSDERRLAEITYGTRDPNRTTIWTGNATAPYWKDKARFEGDLGRVYGVQWRKWKGANGNIDQLQNIIDTIRTNPTDRRMVLTAFNVGELDQMALPPCHMFCQFYVDTKTNKLSCQMYMRSADLFLGVPFNIASYAALTHMVAKVTNLDVGNLNIVLGDAHIYLNHVDQVREQLTRAPREFPTLRINRSTINIDHFIMDDFELIGYNPHPAISAPMAV